MKIKEMSSNLRPRERFKKVGKENLSDDELIAIILKTGTKNNSVKELSLSLLKEIKTIYKLKDIRINQLKKIKGIGEVKAIELLASIELGKRIFLKKEIDYKKVCNSKDIYNYFKHLIKDKKQEYFYSIYLDNKKRIINYKLLFIGTLNMSIVHPREIFKEAYLLSASSFICVHNHPSGDLTPSKEDLTITKNLKKIGDIQGIKLLDHVIISNTGYYSFFEHNNI